MLRSLFSGISGLRQQQTMMDVVGNNIANVNTTGFKSSSVIFEDTLSQLVRAAGAPSNNQGGINPAQVGLGVQLGGISNNFGQGSAQSTGRSTDLMIQGDGFFVVRQGTENVFTRAGAFTFDSNGRLVTNEGNVVQGWMRSAGTVSTDGLPTDIILPAGSLISPKASTTITVGGNITAGTTGTLTLGSTVYDGAGNANPLTISFTSNGTTYDVNVLNSSGASIGTGVAGFTATGAYDSSASSAPSVTLPDGTVIAIDMTGTSSYGGPKSLAVTASDGYAAGSLQQFRISQDGTIVGIFSNGQKLDMAKIALANFNNPSGLEKIGSTSYRATTNSGTTQIGTPSGGGRGSLLGGSLEMSNVDLAQEFTGLIVAQRGFQANSRVITTSDQMLEDLVNIKR